MDDSKTMVLVTTYQDDPSSQAWDGLCGWGEVIVLDDCLLICLIIRAVIIHCDYYCYQDCDHDDGENGDDGEDGDDGDDDGDGGGNGGE